MEHLAVLPLNGDDSAVIGQRQGRVPTGASAESGPIYTRIELGQAELTLWELEYRAEAWGVSLKSILA